MVNLPLRFLTCSESQLYREFVKENPNTTISPTVFRKYTPTEFKRARRDQDKCGTCFEGKKMIKKLKELRVKLLRCGCLRQHQVSGVIDDYTDDTPYLRTLNQCAHLSDNEKYYWGNLINTIHEIQYHRYIEKTQRLSFKADIKRCQQNSGTMLIVVDWKENYSMKGGAVAVGRDFYHKVMVSIMGVVIYCKDIQNGKAQHLPIVSNVLTHDGTTAKMNINKALSKIGSLYPTALEQLKSVSVWADT